MRAECTEDRVLTSSKIVVPVLRREEYSGWRRRGDCCCCCCGETSSLVRTVSAVLEAGEYGEEIALLKEVDVELGAEYELRNSFKTSWI